MDSFFLGPRPWFILKVLEVSISNDKVLNSISIDKNFFSTSKRFLQFWNINAYSVS